MKVIYLLLIAFCTTTCLNAQTSNGTISYEKTKKQEFELPEEFRNMGIELPKEIKVNMDLVFNENESLYKASKKMASSNSNPFEQKGNIQVKTMNSSKESQIYCNANEKKLLQAKDVFGKKFIIESVIEKKKWKLLPEQKELLGYQCVKATLEEQDKLITAWFTTEIQIPVGPEMYYGLPGVILEVQIQGEDIEETIVATDIQLTDDPQPIKAPRKGKVISQEEYEVILENQLKEFESIYGGDSKEGNTIIFRSSGN